MEFHEQPTSGSAKKIVFLSISHLGIVIIDLARRSPFFSEYTLYPHLSHATHGHTLYIRSLSKLENIA